MNCWWLDSCSHLEWDRNSGFDKPFWKRPWNNCHDESLKSYTKQKIIMQQRGQQNSPLFVRSSKTSIFTNTIWAHLIFTIQFDFWNEKFWSVSLKIELSDVWERYCTKWFKISQKWTFRKLNPPSQDNTGVFARHQKQNRNSFEQKIKKPRFAKFSISLSSQDR